MSKKSFEQNMDRLAEIADILENSDTSLDYSVKLYKEAVKTVKLLKNELDNVKSAVVLMKKDADGVFTEAEVYEDEL